MTDTDNADDGEEEEYGELERHSGIPDDGTGDGLKDEGVPSGYSEGIITLPDDDEDGSEDADKEGGEEEYGELERYSGMPDDGSSGDELADGAVPHGYGDAPGQSDDKENA